MILSMIAAMSDNRVIGRDNKLPWHLPADMEHFRTITLDQVVIMGRSTYESIGHPLPGRRNIVISRDQSFINHNTEVFGSPEQAIHALASEGVEQSIVIGGGQLYKSFMPYIDILYLTNVHVILEGDTYFPDYDQSEWRIESEVHHFADGRNPYDYTFRSLYRVKCESIKNNV